MESNENAIPNVNATKNNGCDNSNSNSNTTSSSSKLDLADLDLSQLRLTKKDLETLSSLTPELPKHVQEQLMAQLPPEQARKLSRTLSMQTPSKPVGAHIYKRSMSSNSRDVTPVNEQPVASSQSKYKSQMEPPLKVDRGYGVSDRNSMMCRSLSRGRCSSRELDPNNRFSYSGDIKSNESDFGSYNVRSLRPPPTGGCMSTPPTDLGDSPTRRRSLQKRTSRFLRPDFFDNQPLPMDDNYYVRTKNERERETQNVLREIRERSRDRSRDHSRERYHHRESSVDPAYLNAANNCMGYGDKLMDMRSFASRNKRKNSIPNIQTGDAYSICKASCATLGESALPRTLQEYQKQSSSTIGAITDDGTIDANKPSMRKDDQTSTTDTIVSKKVVVAKPDAKPVKLKAIATSIVIEPPILTNVNNIEMVTQLNNQIDSVTLPLKASKLTRPKSYPSKELSRERSESNSVSIKSDSDEIKKKVMIVGAGTEASIKSTAEASTISSLASTCNSITDAVEKLIEKGSERLSPSKTAASRPKIDSSATDSAVPTVTIKKKVKVVKKKSSDVPKATDNAEPAVKLDSAAKDKSPEKKVKSGFLYSIGQKFEKIRESSKSKEKKTQKSSSITALKSGQSSPSKTIHDELASTSSEPNATTIVAPIASATPAPQSLPTPTSAAPKTVSIATAKSDQRKAKIDAMIRNLRDRSLSRTVAAETRDPNTPITESGLIKRAVSVEDMTKGISNFNRCNVDKVMNMFKSIEKDQQQPSKASGDVEGTSRSSIAMAGQSDSKERPRSSGFASKLKKARPYYTGAKSDSIVTIFDKFDRQLLIDQVDQQIAAASSRIPKPQTQSAVNNNGGCADCVHNSRQGNGDTNGTRKESISTSCSPSYHSTHENAMLRTLTSNDRERIRNNRKALVLDLSNAHIDNSNFDGNVNNNNNNNFNSIDNSYSGNNISNNNVSKYTTSRCQPKDNNNGDAGSSSFVDLSESKNSAYDMATNYLSDTRSNNDDGASSSTFLSPTDETDIHDDWSVYSGELFVN